MFESEKDFFSHEKHENEQLQSLPVELLGIADDLDDLIQPKSHLKEVAYVNESETFTHFDMVLEELLFHLDTYASANIIIQNEAILIRQQGQRFKKIFSELLPKARLSDKDIMDWSLEFDEFTKKIKELPKKVSEWDAAKDFNTPPSFN